MAKLSMTQTSPHDSPGTGFLSPRISAKFGVSNAGGVGQITRYNSKMVQDRCTVPIKIK